MTKSLITKICSHKHLHWWSNDVYHGPKGNRQYFYDMYAYNTIPFHIYLWCSWFSELHSEQLTKIFALSNFQWYWANNIFMSSQLLFLGNWQYLKHSQEQVCLRLAYSVYYRILSVNYLISIENRSMKL